jgi:26S proteasome regulatory subunit N3
VIPLISKFTELSENIEFITKSQNNAETRYVARAMRSTTALRKRLTAEILSREFERHLNAETRAELQGYLNALNESHMDVDAPQQAQGSNEKVHAPQIGDVALYLRLLTTFILIDQKRIEHAISCSNGLLQTSRFQSLSARSYAAYSRAYELGGRLEEIRSNLLSAYRTAALRHHEESQSTLLNLLLRNYLHYNLYEQADKLVSKSTFSESAPSNQLARFLFYQGKIKAIQLDYTEAFSCLQQAGRKAPQSANGFRIAVAKLTTIVLLLMGEIPERASLRGKAMGPYYLLARAVRSGDLKAFHDVLVAHTPTFQQDKTFTLITRFPCVLFSLRVLIFLIF